MWRSLRSQLFSTWAGSWSGHQDQGAGAGRGHFAGGITGRGASLRHAMIISIISGESPATPERGIMGHAQNPPKQLAQLAPHARTPGGYGQRDSPGNGGALGAALVGRSVTSRPGRGHHQRGTGKGQAMKHAKVSRVFEGSDGVQVATSTGEVFTLPGRAALFPRREDGAAFLVMGWEVPGGGVVSRCPRRCGLGCRGTFPITPPVLPGTTRPGFFSDLSKSRTPAPPLS